MKSTFYEFFAGGGMARAGLGSAWTCAFANDFDEVKAATYRNNWGSKDLLVRDVADVDLDELPGVADLSWASFPCQDLSLAGEYRGMGHHASATRTRSGTFWPFWRLMRDLVKANRAPRIIVLENVFGALTSHQGKDFSAIASALSGSGYRFGAVVINARLFVPQSRSRVFFIGVRSGEEIPMNLLCQGPSSWHPTALVRAYESISLEAKKKWLWWHLPTPPLRETSFADLIEDVPTGVEWHTKAETRHLLAMMSPINLAKVKTAKSLKRKVVGGVYKRTRVDENGIKKQRAEVRFDDVAGCLRTPSGGSSRQSILVVDGEQVRSRLISPREAARLMGLPEDYKLPTRYNDAYYLAGDGVCVSVVRHLTAYLLEPIIKANNSEPSSCIAA